jgi:hypothetical protein
MRFPLISTQDAGIPTSTRTLSRVRGFHCPDRGEAYGSYSKAFYSALASVPEANALVDVEVRKFDRGVGVVCVEVTGNAIRL